MNGAQNTYNLSKIVVVLAMFVSSLGFAKTLKYVCTENGLPLKEFGPLSNRNWIPSNQSVKCSLYCGLST